MFFSRFLRMLQNVMKPRHKVLKVRCEYFIIRLFCKMQVSGITDTMFSHEFSVLCVNAIVF